ncbi:tyrosine-protein kinase domain-containing protein [Salsipaludibacter albus]|uniref:tyrosine-protein kinase domain-containing protein n=1 Tax=Salsipaludibacter albus TaxID=2849650 RepID=UPI001EE41D7F|nr:tyrosine-protein kinase domain-containing protein [Salsipaludibacter albus]MBY5163592.1 polysaccharide biosynthesis tyrosine autokinase [Salsipaludibacter albus]
MTTSAPPDEPLLELGHVLQVLRRRTWTVLAVTALVFVLGLAATRYTVPVYEATTEVVVEPFQQASDASLEEIVLGDTTVNTERRVLASRTVSDRVVDELELDRSADDLLDQVRVTVVPDTRVLQVRVSDPDPEMAAELADAFAANYLAHRRDEAVASLLAAQRTLGDRREAMAERLTEIEEELAELVSESNPLEDVGIEPAPSADPAVAALAAERASLLAQMSDVANQSAQAEVGARLLKGGGQVLNAAQVPDTPASPRPVRNAILALLLGLMLGIGLAFLRDHLDDVIRDEDDARRAGRQLPVLGRIPHSDEGRRLATIVDPQGPPAEAYRALSAGVRFLLAAHGRDDGDEPDDPWSEHDTDGIGRAVLLTSPDPGDGKSTTAGNLAVSAARAGMRVVMVDAEMRRPTIHDRFGIPAGMGLSDVIAGDVEVDDVLVDIGVDNLRVLPAGTLPPNPSDLLASGRMRSLVRFLCERTDLVVLDGPPVLAVSDALEMAPKVSAVLMVVRAGTSRRRALHDALERLDSVRAVVSGLVVNDLDQTSNAYHYYQRAYEYRAQPQDEGGRRSRRSRRSRRNADDQSESPEIRRGAGLPGAGDGDGVASDDPAMDEELAPSGGREDQAGGSRRTARARASSMVTPPPTASSRSIDTA